jgi:hypothetical protein
MNGMKTSLTLEKFLDCRKKFIRDIDRRRKKLATGTRNQGQQTRNYINPSEVITV